MPLTKVSTSRCFDGDVLFYTHTSESTRTKMSFSVYIPPQAKDAPVPVLYWLSGLTCTAENFTTKAGAQRYAAEHGIALVAPDTSPRGEHVADAPDSYDLGQGAGFYLNATEEPWAPHYNMYDYVMEELPQVLAGSGLNLDLSRSSIFGHSMGGHGALICALKNPGRFRSVSAFAPICAPMDAPWGKKAFTAYLGEDQEAWEAYDTCALIEHAQERLPLLIDQGTDDSFLGKELMPDRLEAACAAHNHPLMLRMRVGYDHSYYFIASFVGEHIAHHAKALLS